MDQKLIIHRWTDYPLDWGEAADPCYTFLPDKSLKFSKILTLEFFDSLTQILVVFLSRKTVHKTTRTEYFSDDCLYIVTIFSSFCCGPESGGQNNNS